MKFRVHCKLDYTLDEAASFLFAFRCVETGGQKILTESLMTDPPVENEEFHVGGGMNRFTRIKTWNPGTLAISYQADLHTSVKLTDVDTLAEEPTENLPPDVICYLFPSRYCESDRVRQMAHEIFGHLEGNHVIAAAVSDWVFRQIEYVSGSSGESCSAIDILNSRQGVCRDFAHLGIALCRALNLPARYVTCYAHQLVPQDFHACFEVFIGGIWHVFDPTRLAPLNGLVRIATGRDAADAAVCTIFGNPELTLSLVSCECLDPRNFTPITRDDLAAKNQAIALL
jgi:transglutaminase-like putative cysteine protease